VKRAIVAILAAIGGLVILFVLFFVALSWAVLSPTPLPSRVVLELDLDRGLVEAVPQDAFALAFERRRLTTREVVEGLERAADDGRVVGLLVRGGTAFGGWGRVEEVREAVLRFRAGGKPAVFFAETIGDFGAGQGSYYLASAFDEVILQPSGDVGLMPLVAEAPFLRGTLEKLDVVPRFDARWEYKDATEIFTERGFSERSREAVEALLESILTTAVEGIAEGRGLPPDSVRALVRDGPFMAREGLAAGLIDRLGYLDEARDRARELSGEEGAERLAFRSWIERDGRAWTRGPRVALVYGTGIIERGEGRWDPLSGVGSFGAATVAANVRAAVDDDRVRAIVLRVESPGGSYPASDVVRRELERAREAGKPVVVSMGDYAASGGYLVAAGADRVVAHPGTLTGSIGVAGGKMVTDELWERFGVEWDRVEAGGETTFDSPIEDFSEEEWERFQAFLDRIYEEFLGHVAEGRGMSRGEADRVARGRVWTGRDALERGLVDELGGFQAALRQVRELLELEEDAPVQVALFPPERTFLQLLLEDGWRVAAVRYLGVRAGEDGALAAALRPVQSPVLGPLLTRAARLGLLGGDDGLLLMPPLEVPAP
jgi:protease IV